MEENADLSPIARPEERADPKGAGPLLRTGAFAIDVLLVGTAAWLWDFAVWRLVPLSAPGIVRLGILVMVVLYYGWATARNYHTPGQGFVGLTLARSDYQPLTARRAYSRVVLFWATAGMALPNLIIMLFDKKRRMIHDRLTKTWVYELPDVARRRRWIAVTAAIALIALSGARFMLGVSDYLEQRDRLTIEEIGAGADGDETAISSRTRPGNAGPSANSGAP